MPKTTSERNIRAVRARCESCGWEWHPRPATRVDGSQGNRSAVTAAQYHGRAFKHLVIVTRDTTYDYRLPPQNITEEHPMSTESQVRAPLTRPVAQVLATEPYGNAYSDHNLWSEVYRIALNTDNPIPVRAAAIRKMDEITGCDETAGQNDETAVASFVDDMMSDCGVGTFADGVDP